jgi:hypothetical protein
LRKQNHITKPIKVRYCVNTKKKYAHKSVVQESLLTNKDNEAGNEESNPDTGYDRNILK